VKGVDGKQRRRISIATTKALPLVGLGKTIDDIRSMKAFSPSGLSKGRSIMAAIVLVTLLLLGVVLEQFREAFQCREKMLTLLDHLRRSQLETGTYPQDIVALATYDRWANKSNTFFLHVLVCPGSNTRDLTFANAIQQSDYVYLNWAALLGTNSIPGNYPLLYDKRMNNHCGIGINIQPVAGRRFWDFRARWLRRFAAEHPQYDIPLPK
jgi:hypothetical protein